MSELSTTELCQIEFAPAPEPAVRKCDAAYRRAYNAYMEANVGKSCIKSSAARAAGLAYRNAMPLLSSFEGIRDFIACTAHGILVGSIPPEQSGRILYAAQVALATLQREPKPRKPA